jgi:TRAP-type C4-dicarboxylate transport system substrate-binding protein
MNKIKRIMLFTLSFLVITTMAFSLTIKIASIAPENSPWGKELNILAAEWKKISNGRVILKIYHNGIAGDEGTVLRKMKMGQLHGGIFTARGLSSLFPDITVISYPFLIKTDDELDYVMTKIKPMLNQQIEAKGYKILAWSKAGWVRFFGTSKIEVPEDLKSHKLVSNPLDQAFITGFKQRSGNRFLGQSHRGRYVPVVRNRQAYDKPESGALDRRDFAFGKRVG